MEIKKYLNNYIEDLKARNFSPHTIDSYSRHLSKFSNFTGDITPKAITVSLIDKYRNTLQSRNPNTINHHLTSLRAFLKYLARKQIPTLPAEAVELGKGNIPEVSFLESVEVDKLLSAVKTKTYTGKRNKAILEVLLATGLRVSELTNLKISQINFDRKEFTIRGKGGKLRIGFLTSEAVKAIKTWLSSRNDSSEYLFVSNRATNPQKLSSRAVQRLVSKYVTKAGIIKRVSPHTLRHTYATELLRKVNNLRVVGELLGHASIATTSRYTHVTNGDLRNAYLSAKGKFI